MHSIFVRNVNISKGKQVRPESIHSQVYCLPVIHMQFQNQLILQYSRLASPNFNLSTTLSARNSQKSKMHELFAIPEVVAAILLTDTVEHVLLQNCLTVNRLFSHEAIRILWERCGTDFSISYGYLRNKIPPVHALAKIAARDISRAQYYADCIRELRFTRMHEDWPRIGDNEQWHDRLLDLRFPILDSLASDACYKYNAPPDALIATGPFYEFKSPERAGLFWHVRERSPKLKILDLTMEEPEFFESVQDEAIKFIKSTPVLSSLSLVFRYREERGFLFNVWQPGVLNALATLPAFHKLIGQNLSANFLQDLPEGSFPALETIATGYAGSLSAIPSAFPHLTSLKLELSEPINEGLGSFAKLSNLTSLDLTFAEDEESSFSAADLLAIANGCPLLTTVNLPSAAVLKCEDPCPRGEGINDATIEEFARALPNLTNLCIGLEDRTALSHQAIISLARHCPELGYFHITADVSMPDLIEGLTEIGEVPLPDMHFMRVYVSEDRQHTYENAAELAGRLLGLAPGLCEFEIFDGSESDKTLEGLVEKLIGVPGAPRQ